MFALSCILQHHAFCKDVVGIVASHLSRADIWFVLRAVETLPCTMPKHMIHLLTLDQLLWIEPYTARWYNSSFKRAVNGNNIAACGFLWRRCKTCYRSTQKHHILTMEMYHWLRAHKFIVKNPYLRWCKIGDMLEVEAVSWTNTRLIAARPDFAQVCERFGITSDTVKENLRLHECMRYVSGAHKYITSEGARLLLRDVKYNRTPRPTSKELQQACKYVDDDTWCMLLRVKTVPRKYVAAALYHGRVDLVTRMQKMIPHGITWDWLFAHMRHARMWALLRGLAPCDHTATIRLCLDPKPCLIIALHRARQPYTLATRSSWVERLLKVLKPA